MLEFSIVTITTFVAMLNECTKYFANLIFKKDIKKYIPVFSVFFGIALGVVGYYLPNVEMGNNIVEAVFIGIAAGAGSTGVHQIGKQLAKSTDSTTNTETSLADELNEYCDIVDTYLNGMESDETTDDSAEVEDTSTEENNE